jgi:hypothetical protein
MVERSTWWKEGKEEVKEREERGEVRVATKQRSMQE